MTLIQDVKEFSTVLIRNLTGIFYKICEDDPGKYTESWQEERRVDNNHLNN